MNILFLCDFNDRTLGGVLTSVNSQRDELRRQGHRVFMICPAQDQEPGRQNDTFYLPSLPFIRPSSYAVPTLTSSSLNYLYTVVVDFGPIDIIHSHTTSILSNRAAALSSKLDAPLIQTMHGRDDVFFETSVPFHSLISTTLMLFNPSVLPTRFSIPHKNELSYTARNLWSIMLRRCFQAQYTTFPSMHLAALFRYHGLSSDSSTVISNGLPDVKFDAMAPGVMDRTVHSKSIRTIIWAGRMSPEKRPEVFIDMMRRIGKRGNIKAIMYGDGPLVQKFRSLVQSDTALSHVTIHGAYENDMIQEYMLSADLLVYTSYGFDNQPMVMLEAVVAGLPVVYCDPNLSECMPEAGASQSLKPTAESLQAAVMALVKDQKVYHSLCTGMIEGRDAFRQSTVTFQMVELYQKALQR